VEAPEQADIQRAVLTRQNDCGYTQIANCVLLPN
jgi:hypothetical protein